MANGPAVSGEGSLQPVFEKSAVGGGRWESDTLATKKRGQHSGREILHSARVCLQMLGYHLEATVPLEDREVAAGPGEVAVLTQAVEPFATNVRA